MRLRLTAICQSIQKYSRITTTMMPPKRYHRVLLSCSCFFSISCFWSCLNCCACSYFFFSCSSRCLIYLSRSCCLYFSRCFLCSRFLYCCFVDSSTSFYFATSTVFEVSRFRLGISSFKPKDCPFSYSMPLTAIKSLRVAICRTVSPLSS